MLIYSNKTSALAGSDLVKGALLFQLYGIISCLLLRYSHLIARMLFS